MNYLQYIRKHYLYTAFQYRPSNTFIGWKYAIKVTKLSIGGEKSSWWVPKHVADSQNSTESGLRLGGEKGQEAKTTPWLWFRKPSQLTILTRRVSTQNALRTRSKISNRQSGVARDRQFRTLPAPSRRLILGGRRPPPVFPPCAQEHSSV